MEHQPHHDRRDNELLDFFQAARAWLSVHGTQVLVVLAIVAVVFAGQSMWHSYKLRAHEQAWGTLATATSPEIAEQHAQRSSNPTVKALANLKAADLYLRSTIEPEAVIELTPEDLAASLDKAERLYQQIWDNTESIHPAIRYNAGLGLARVAESRGQWDKARGIYEQIQRQTADKYHSIHAQATSGLDMLPTLARKVVFKPEVKADKDTPAEDDASSPQVTPAPQAAPAGDETTPLPGAAPLPGAGAGDDAQP